MRRVFAGLRAARIRPHSGVRVAAAVAGVLFLAACTPVDASTAGPAAPAPSLTPPPKPPATRKAASSTAAPSTAAPTTAPTTVPPAGTVAPLPKPKLAPKPAPKPAPTPAPKPAPAPSTCDPNYAGQCLKDGIGDYDCSSGSGNGPNYVYGTVRVVGSDPFALDRDHNGLGCEDG
jgi:hypothetical protein